MIFETRDDGDVEIALRRCWIAGWTGRDAAKVQEHIEELAAIGVPRPSTTPLYYAAPAASLTQSERVQTLGGDSGGEAEPLLVDDGERLWLGLGSDHTDRALEATSVAHSKAVCAKPVSRGLWPFDAVADRLDALEMASEISDNGVVWEPYQRGTLAAILPLSALAAGAPGAAGGRLGAGVALLCGTLPAIGGVRPTPFFRASLVDPTTSATLRLCYRLETLPIAR